MLVHLLVSFSMELMVELPNNSNNADTIYYAGVNPDVIKAKITANQPLENVGPDPNNLNTGALKKSDLSTILNHNKRPTNILYRWGVNLNNLTFDYFKKYPKKARVINSIFIQIKKILRR